MAEPLAPLFYDLPAKVIWQGVRPLVEVKRVLPEHLTLPFWDDIVGQGEVVGFQSLDSCPVPSERVLSGGIFHTYRCGSTLLCRQLSALPGTFALAEPNCVSQLITGAEQDTALLRARLLKLFGLVRQGLGARGERLVIKWLGHLADRSAEIAAALPEIPMLFLHRDPVEVLASIERRPLGNMQGVPQHQRVPDAAGDARSQGLQKVAAMLAGMCRAVAKTGEIARLDYTDLNEPTMVLLLNYFGLTADEAGLSAMRAAGTWYSKAAAGALAFSADSTAKQTESSALARDLARAIVAPALREAAISLPYLTAAMK